MTQGLLLVISHKFHHNQSIYDVKNAMLCRALLPENVVTDFLMNFSTKIGGLSDPINRAFFVFRGL